MKLRWAERASRDLRAIAAYIRRDSHSNALGWINRLREQAKLAAEHPYAGRVVPEFGREDIREVLLRSYRIVYRVGKDDITVLTVFEGHRLLDGELSSNEAT